MCPPDLYGIHYEINPWMDMSRQAEHPVTKSQGPALQKNTIPPAKKFSLLNPVPAPPVLFSPPTPAIISHKKPLLPLFPPQNRRGKHPTTRRWLAKNGF